MHSLVMADNKEIRNAKGVIENIADNIKQREYVDVLTGKKMMRHFMKQIENKLHKVWTYNVCKSSLSCLDYSIRWWY